MWLDRHTNLRSECEPMKLPNLNRSRALLKTHLLEQLTQHRIPVGGRLPSETSLMQSSC